MALRCCRSAGEQRAKQWGKAGEVLEWMKESPHVSRKDAQVFSILCAALLKDGDLDQAAQVR